MATILHLAVLEPLQREEAILAGFSKGLVLGVILGPAIILSAVWRELICGQPAKSIYCFNPKRQAYVSGLRTMALIEAFLVYMVVVLVLFG